MDSYRGSTWRCPPSARSNISRGFPRCIRCNEPLVSITKELAKDGVPPYVYETQEEFMKCPLCLRMYWRGTHWANMHEELAQLRG